MKSLFVFVVVLLFCQTAWSSDVSNATPENFDELVGSSLPAFVEFYAPWCGHCKHLAPEYEIVATSFKGQPVRIVAVDCDAHKSLSSRFGVTGYPTLKFFPADSTDGETYTGGRTAADIIDYINKKIGTHVRVKTAPTAVTTLTPDNFDSVVLDPTKNVLVEFYAPWCGHCKKLVPEYEKVAKTFEGEDEVVIAKCDADAHRDLGSKFGVSGFPTIKYFPKDNKKGEDYGGGRTADDFVNFINEKVQTDRVIGGGFLPSSGRISELDTLATKFMASNAATKNTILEEVQKLENSDSIKSDKNAKYAKFYTLAMKKLVTDPDYISKETARLERMLSSATLKPSDFAQFNKRKNVLNAFTA